MPTATETAKYTPFPWAGRRGSSGQGLVIADNGANVAVVYDDTTADTDLLGAAPDLLLAAKSALDLLEGVAAEEERKGKRNAAMNVRAVERDLRDAVRKAEGSAA